MAAVTLTVEDLTPFASIAEPKAQAMIDDVLALAARVAPCILTEEFEYAAAAKAILRGAVLRWNDTGSGAVQSQTAGPFGQTITPAPRKSTFWPSEIQDLQALCKATPGDVGIFAVDTVATTGAHSVLCALNFGALYCSCGADLTANQYPLYEV